MEPPKNKAAPAGTDKVPMRKALALFSLFGLLVNSAFAGLSVARSNGITLTGADGIQYVGISGITLTGADGLLTSKSNGITLTGADGITLTGADGITLTGADSAAYAGPNGITLTGADGITLTGADGITLTGADGITLTGADGTKYRADSIIIQQPNGITLTGADGITLTGADGITLTGADGITLTGADGVTLTGADGITLTGADSVIGMGLNGVVFELAESNGITLTGADGITLTGADGITLTGADGITLTGADGITLTGADDATGLQSLDPELALLLNSLTDDSNVNAVIVFHDAVTDSELDQLRQVGITGGTRFRRLPMVQVSATKSQLIAVSRLASVRSIYGTKTLTLNSDPYFNTTGIQRLQGDSDLRSGNDSLPVTGRGVTVAVLDTGINALHPDLSGRVTQNVRLADVQSLYLGFVYPVPVENVANSDLAAGHGTFVGGVIAGSGASSGGKFAGVAPGAHLLGLSAGDLNLIHVLSGFDYLLDKGLGRNVRVVNCSFSANTVYDPHDPVNIATKMLTDSGVSVVFSAGNSGSGNGSLNPYAAAPWVIGVGATDRNGTLAEFSSRGNFGDQLQHPSIVAPGVNIAGPRSAAGITGLTGLAGADAERLSLSELPYYTTASGTSFSAPQVAGAIALMLEVNPNLTPAEIKDILSRTATPLPKYFYHEAGAGMLNTHAAVLEAAFPERRMGVFRSVISRNLARFITSAVTFEQNVAPGTASASVIEIPQNTVQASVSISWGLSPNDFALKLFDPVGRSAGSSNYLNLPGLTGRREKIVLRTPASGTFRAETNHTGSLGSVQAVYGVAEITRIEYPDLLDLSSLSTSDLDQVQHSLISNLLLPEGRKFRPEFPVSRAELAEAILRGGLVPQFVAADPMFTDVRSIYSRNSVESVQANPGGKLFVDASAGGRFHPYNSATRLIAAVAFVKASGLDSAAASAVLPATVLDARSIPAQWRGYVAVALQKGFLVVDSDQRFDPNRAVTRLELAKAMNLMVNR